MKLYSFAPWYFAVAKNRSGIRIASIVPSGTRTAPSSRGSTAAQRKRLALVNSWIGIPHSLQPRTKSS